MKRTIFGLFALSATATAMAQSSVTLYGIVDNCIVYETNHPNGNVFAGQSGGWAQSRFGLKGAEDLGGGTHAIFQLESRLNTMNGSVANGSFFEGQATVGLQNDTWGRWRKRRVVGWTKAVKELARPAKSYVFKTPLKTPIVVWE